MRLLSKHYVQLYETVKKYVSLYETVINIYLAMNFLLFCLW